MRELRPPNLVAHELLTSINVASGASQTRSCIRLFAEYGLFSWQRDNLISHQVEQALKDRGMLYGITGSQRLNFIRSWVRRSSIFAV